VIDDECDVKQQFPLANHPSLLRGGIWKYTNKKNSPPAKGEYPEGGRGV
jgi:hypothetical protein